VASVGAEGAAGVSVSGEDDASVGCAVGLLVFVASGVFLLVGVAVARVDAVAGDVAVAALPLSAGDVATTVLFDWGVGDRSPEWTEVPTGVKRRVGAPAAFVSIAAGVDGVAASAVSVAWAAGTAVALVANGAIASGGAPTLFEISPDAFALCTLVSLFAAALAVSGLAATVPGSIPGFAVGSGCDRAVCL